MTDICRFVLYLTVYSQFSCFSPTIAESSNEMVAAEKVVNSLEKLEVGDGLGVGEDLSRLTPAVSRNAFSVATVPDLRFVTSAGHVLLPALRVAILCVTVSVFVNPIRIFFRNLLFSRVYFRVSWL